MKCWTAVMIVVQLAAAASAMSFLSVVLDEWHLFKLQHKKSYKSSTEENFRMKIFLENKKIIATHNQLFTLGKKTYSLQMNQFGDMLHSEFLSVMNGLRWSRTDGNNSERPGLSAATFIGPDDDVIIPDTVDWRQKGAVTPIKNQGQCGSCWAFSATGSLEGQHFRKTGKLVSLSEQNLVDCTKRDGNLGCGGGYMDVAFKYVKENGGIDTEQSYPYEAKDDSCRYNPMTSGAEDVGFVDIPHGDEQALQMAVAAVGPISVGMDASAEGFMFYKNGIYESNECNPVTIDHGVLAVGYGTENGTDYWLVKNSWGTQWGEEGYFKIRRNHNNMCGIASTASYPLV